MAIKIRQGGSWVDVSGSGISDSLWSAGSGVDGDGNSNIYRFSQVGIGTTNPATRLHVKSSAAGSSTIVTIESTVNTAESAIRFLTNGSDWEIGSKGSAAALNPDDFYIYDSTRGVFKLIIGDGANGDLRFNSGFGTAATAYGVRAWVNFDGSGSIGVNQTIRGSGNVTSVFKSSTGNYTINFTNAMPDANYTFGWGRTGGLIRNIYINSSASLTTNSLSIIAANTIGLDDGVDVETITITVVR